MFNIALPLSSVPIVVDIGWYIEPIPRTVHVRVNSIDRLEHVEGVAVFIEYFSHERASASLIREKHESGSSGDVLNIDFDTFVNWYLQKVMLIDFPTNKKLPQEMLPFVHVDVQHREFWKHNNL